MKREGGRLWNLGAIKEIAEKDKLAKETEELEKLEENQENMIA